MPVPRASRTYRAPRVPGAPRIPRFPDPAATGTMAVEATPADAYRVVSDPAVMARLAEETCRVTDADPGRRFVYEVTATPLGIPISRWQYDIEPAGSGCTVTETSRLRVPLWFAPAAIAITGVRDRVGANSAHVAATLGRLKGHLEASTGAPR